MGKRGRQDPNEHRARREAAAERELDVLLGSGELEEKRQAEPFAYRVAAVQAWQRGSEVE